MFMPTRNRGYERCTCRPGTARLTSTRSSPTTARRAPIGLDVREIRVPAHGVGLAVDAAVHIAVDVRAELERLLWHLNVAAILEDGFSARVSRGASIER